MGGLRDLHHRAGGRSENRADGEREEIAGRPGENSYQAIMND